MVFDGLTLFYIADFPNNCNFHLFSLYIYRKSHRKANFIEVGTGGGARPPRFACK
jgi:hypothetical protein